MITRNFQRLNRFWFPNQNIYVGISTNETKYGNKHDSKYKEKM